MKSWIGWHRPAKIDVRNKRSNGSRYGVVRSGGAKDPTHAKKTRMLTFGRKLTSALTAILVAASFFVSPVLVSGAPSFQGSAATPLQLAIEKQAERLKSSEIEERRDALMRLAAMHRAEACRVAIPALSDSEPIVRVTAAGALRSLPGDEAASSLLPLLNDRDEFVRREGAYALGHSRSRIAVAPLIERLNTDK